MISDPYQFPQRIVLPPIQSLFNNDGGVNGIRPRPLVPRSYEILDSSPTAYFQSVRTFDRSFIDTNRSIPMMYPPPPINIPSYGIHYHNIVPPTTNYYQLPPPPQNPDPITFNSSPQPTTYTTPMKNTSPLTRITTPATTAVTYNGCTPYKPDVITTPQQASDCKVETPKLVSDYKFALNLTPAKSSQLKDQSGKGDSKLHSLTTVAMALASQSKQELIPNSLEELKFSKINGYQAKTKKHVFKNMVTKVKFDNHPPSLLPVTIPKLINKEFVQVIQTPQCLTVSERPATGESKSTCNADNSQDNGSTKTTVRKRKVKPGKVSKSGKNRNIYGHCLHCGQEDTPEWRNGPQGKATLCNACGLFFKKLKKHFGNETIAIQYMQHRCLVDSEDRTMPKHNE
ncbi:GATA zinc finger [Nakaseomyces bracarensis]|uniref:GATA zinc finger n=1 Tax=Nakaseomyces bracarensis TaxID=273131 RepID=A0ABR4NQL6_9SACH